MVILLATLLIVSLLPLTIAILLSRWRPSWSYFKVALLAAAPIPVALTGLALFIFSSAPGVGFVATAAVVSIPLFVVGVMAGAVGAWMTPRPPAPVVTKDEIESIFQ